ncbi:MAG TPA: 16S rRNA (cytidine(1402)-2'-O)-methyltransferase [Candidatus Acidoferrales bacterium]|nr:16S rRNA (cytidine(1402)-2'-O)-methyltransferase [Candidatus Acidoferrales bacterium]
MSASSPERGAAAGARGTLYVVATPIGNLGDVTLRALEILRAVPLVACEDTRITSRLLGRHGITTRLTSFHARSAPARLASLLDHLRTGADLALTTDAGTPGVSDPGEDLVAAWAAEGGTIVPIPGASAVLAAVMGSGIAGPRWSFEGFLPRSGRERRERLARIAADDRASILYEAPTRIGATLRDLAAAAGSDRRAAVCRELTKLHEQIARGTLAELAELVASGGIPPRGEIAVVVAGRPPDAHAAASAGTDDNAAAVALAEVEALVATGVGRSEAARRVAAATGIPRRRLYRVSGD